VATAVARIWSETKTGQCWWSTRIAPKSPLGPNVVPEGEAKAVLAQLRYAIDTQLLEPNWARQSQTSSPIFFQRENDTRAPRRLAPVGVSVRSSRWAWAWQDAGKQHNEQPSVTDGFGGCCTSNWGQTVLRKTLGNGDQRTVVQSTDRDSPRAQSWRKNMRAKVYCRSVCRSASRWLRLLIASEKRDLH